MKFLSVFLLIVSSLAAQMRVSALPGKSPLVTFRIVFTTGSVADPPDKPGLAALTAMMLSDSGTKDLTYKQVTDALFPMAAGFYSQVDKEMTAFSGATHVDNLDAYYKIIRDLLLAPGWRQEDFDRVKDDAINAVREGLRNNDEELGKEVLYSEIFRGTRYESYSGGTVSSLEKLTLDDLKRFYKSEYVQAHLILGIAGGYTPAFLETMKKDFRMLPAGAGFRPRPKALAPIEKNRAVIVERDTRSVAFSFGFPISVTRASPDYPALLLASTYLGHHRMSGGVLYDELREARGLNYGDYSYIEYFPRGMYLMEPNPNLGRHQQIFQIWIRPVEPPTAKFALRMAIYQLDKLIKDGIPEEAFTRTREFLSKYVNVLTRTKSAELGYAIDSLWYGTATYNAQLRKALATMTREDVNRVIRRYLRTDRMVIVAVSKNAVDLKRQLVSDDASTLTYNSPKPAAITEVDKIAGKLPLHLSEEQVRIVPGKQIFQ
jgi:zinc protease